MPQAVWVQTKPLKPTDRSVVVLSCGCRLEFTAESQPVRVWVCEHGNEIRAVGA